MWEKEVSKLPDYQKEYEYEYPTVNIYAKYNSPGPLIGLMKAASQEDEFFLNTPEKGHFQEDALRRVFILLRKEFCSLKLEKVFDELFVTKLNVKIRCDCTEKWIVQESPLFFFHVQPDDLPGISLQDILNSPKLEALKYEPACLDCGERYEIIETKLMKIAPYFSFVLGLDIQAHNCDTSIIKLPDQLDMNAMKYEYVSIGCQIRYKVQEETEESEEKRENFLHDFSILREKNFFFEVSDQSFEKYGWKEGLRRAEIFGFLFILKRAT